MNKIKLYIGDERDKCSITEAIGGTDIVFHAKVPSCKFFPMEAVRTR